MRLPLSEHKQLAAALDDPVECLHHKVGTLWPTRRLTMLTTGASAHTSSPASRCSAALQAASPLEIVRAEVRGDSLRRARVDRLDVDAVEHAPELPLAQAHHALEPAAYAGSSSCPAYVGLTVVTASAVIIPAFMAFAQLPISSVSCQRSHESPSRSVTDESAGRP